MAIITDATGRQLAQAVGGIDTGGLAKDTTLQATNTALGNMNATQQGIATAITNLGQLLGSDKANIDGSNIVDKSAFRNAIGVTPVFNSVKQITVSSSSPYTVTFRHQYKSLFLIGFAQGIGNVAIAISSTGSTIDNAKDLLHLTTFSNNALTFTASGDSITISSNNSSLSYFTIIIGNAIVG